MLDRFFQNEALGIEKVEGAVKLAFVVAKQKSWSITKLTTEPLDDVKPLDIEKDENLVQVSALSATDVLVRPLELKLSRKKDIEAVLAFQAEPLIPYPPEEATLDYQLISQEKNLSKITLMSVQSEKLTAHLEELQKENFEPEYVSCTPGAIATFTHFFFKHLAGQSALTIHLGENELLCVLSQKGKLLGDYSLPGGVKGLLKALQDDEHLSPQEAWQKLQHLDFTEPLTPKLQKTIEELQQNVSRTVLALAKQHKIQEVSGIFLTGEGGYLTYMPILLSETLKIEIGIPESTSSFSSKELQEYAVPIGLALQGTLDSEEPINFRKGSFAYPDLWKRSKRPLILYGAASLILSLALLVYGSASYHKQLDLVKKQYISLLETIEKPYSSAEALVHEATPLSLEEHIQMLSASDLENRLTSIQEEIKKGPDLFNLYPNVPRVSDALAWLAKNPLLKRERKASNQPAINLTGFTYTMTKRPDFKKRSEPYQVKIDLEFQTLNSTLAREFHDALIAPNEMVDPKNEVKWSQTGDTYRTTFFLKNKAPSLTPQPKEKAS